jgi:hypothetical protein
MDLNDKPVKHLVVDSSVLIKGAPIKVNQTAFYLFFIEHSIFILKTCKDLSNLVYAVDGVVDEIKDANTRASLQILPYEFKLKTPSSDAVKFGNFEIIFRTVMIRKNFSRFILLKCQISQGKQATTRISLQLICFSSP